MRIITPQNEIVNLKSRDVVQLQCYNCNDSYHHAKHRFQSYHQKWKSTGKLTGCFCSHKCSVDYFHKNCTIEKKCDFCFNSFERNIKQCNKSEKHFCSQSCSAKYWNGIRYPIKNRKLAKKRIPKIPVELECSNCSKLFYRKYLQPNKTKKRFCSKSCQAIYANKNWNRSSRFGINKSRCETILKDIILKSFPDLEILENNRTIVTGGLELDLFIPSKKVAIELNGPCHFIPLFGSEELQKTQHKDLLKIKYCQENNIKFFVVNIMGIKNQTNTLTEVFDNQIKPHLV